MFYENVIVVSHAGQFEKDKASGDRTLKYWVGFQQVQPYLMGEVASLALVGHHSSDGATINMPYGVDVLLYRPVLHPTFYYQVG